MILNYESTMNDSKYLYLVNGERNGEGFWKIGTTDKMDSSSDDDDASACKLPEKEKATLARWAPAAQRRMLERLADRPPVRLGRAKPPQKHDVPNLFGSKKQETEMIIK